VRKAVYGHEHWHATPGTDDDEVGDSASPEWFSIVGYRSSSRPERGRQVSFSPAFHPQLAGYLFARRGLVVDPDETSPSHPSSSTSAAPPKKKSRVPWWIRHRRRRCPARHHAAAARPNVEAARPTGAILIPKLDVDKGALAAGEPGLISSGRSVTSGSDDGTCGPEQRNAVNIGVVDFEPIDKKKPKTLAYTTTESHPTPKTTSSRCTPPTATSRRSR
jgi:hypothetical protein